MPYIESLLHRGSYFVDAEYYAWMNMDGLFETSLFAVLDLITETRKEEDMGKFVAALTRCHH